MASKRTKYQVVDKEGKILESGTLTATSNAKTPEGIPVEPEFEKPLVSVSISNPFKKILYWLNQIRKRQTTTFAFKLSIPLIALPVIIFTAYQVGRGEAMSFIKSNASPSPSATVSASPQSPVEISRAGVLKIAKGSTGTRYLLQLRNGEILNLQIPTTIDLSKYANKQVLVTGYQNKTTGVLSVVDIAEIEVFNVTEIPQTSGSPSPSPSPKESTQGAN